MSTLSRRSLVFIVSLFTLVFVIPSVACARDKTAEIQERIDVYRASIKENKKEKSWAGLASIVDEIRRLFPDLEDANEAAQADLRKDVLDLLGTITKVKSKDAAHAVAEALDVLGGSNDKYVIKYVKPHLKQRDKKKTTKPLLAAIEAAGELPDAQFVAPLLKVFEGSKSTEAAKKAMLALGNYKEITKYREKILLTIVKSIEKSRPGGQPRLRGQAQGLDPNSGNGSGPMGRDSGPGARWRALSRPMAEAANNLTGRDLSMESWFSYVKKNKSKLKDAFVDD